MKSRFIHSHLQNTGWSFILTLVLSLLLSDFLLLHFNLEHHVLNPVGGVSKGEAVVYSDLAESVEDPGYGLAGHGDVLTVLDGPDPPLV